MQRLFYRACLSFAAALSVTVAAHSQVIDYDAGSLTIEGVQVLQDANDPQRFYYLPQYPRLATTDEGEFQLLMLKYLGGEDDANGGIFHALVEFSLPEELREQVEEGLETLRPGAELSGSLPLLQPEDGDAYGSFRITSATLMDATENEGAIGSRVISSGPAPLREGSKAAIAARLTQEDATILMDSLTGTTADISVSVRGYYEAKVKGYNAIVQANMDTVYSHRSVVDSYQKKYTRRQLRNVVDELVQDGAIEINVYDRSSGLGIDASELSSVLDLVTEKLIEVMYDTETGWSQTPTPEQAVTENQIKGRLERGWFQKTFMNADDAPYYTDDQYVQKRREDIRSNSFYLNLSKTTTIRLPFDSTGNLGGFYDSLSESDRESYFRVSAIDEDADVQSRDVFFQIDADTAEGFAENFNSVAVNIRQTRGEDEDDYYQDLKFTPKVVAEDNGLQSINLKRLGDPTNAWTGFEYQTVWSLRGSDDPLRSPDSQDNWIASRDGSIALVPPVQRTEVELEAINTDFEALGIAAAEVKIASTLQGDVRYLASQTVRASDATPRATKIFYRDTDEDIAWQVIWHTRNGPIIGDFQRLEGELIVLFPPSAEWLEERAG